MGEKPLRENHTVLGWLKKINERAGVLKIVFDILTLYSQCYYETLFNKDRVLYANVNDYGNYLYIIVRKVVRSRLQFLWNINK